MTVRIDAHQHFWKLDRGNYDWLTPDLAPLYRDFVPADLMPMLAERSIQQTVLVQAAATVEETKYLLGLAEQFDFIAGVVGWLDMEDSAAFTVALQDLANHPKLVGIRPMIQDIEDPAWITRPDLSAATELLISNGLCFDALVRPVHLPYLLDFLRRHPTLQTVIDHGAKPIIAEGEWEPWAASIAEIASETSSYCKVSGLITEAGSTQSYEDLVPYLDHLLDVFGPERLMWGSDWPVLELAGDYSGWHEAFTTWAAKLTADERGLIEGANAARFYGLEGADTLQDP